MAGGPVVERVQPQPSGSLSVPSSRLQPETRKAIRSACLSIPSRTNLRINSLKSTPLAAQSFAYMLMGVKPGMVFISLSQIAPVDLSMKKSTLASPEPSISSNALTAMLRISSDLSSGRGAGISRRLFGSAYLAS